MPAITAQPVLPTPRPGVEAQVAAVPGYYLSSAVQKKEDAKGTALQQGSIMIEPGELIGLPGLSVGGRYVGKPEEGGYPEPMVRYRQGLDEHGVFAAGVVAYGTHASGESDGASYEATRGGLEVGFDVRTTPESEWAELHFAGSLGVTGLDADGEYCLDADGRWGIDCGDPPTNFVTASASGFYPSAGGAIALDLGRHLDGILHGGRIAIHGAVGAMPRVERAEQTEAKTYTAAGLSITLGLGGAK